MEPDASFTIESIEELEAGTPVIFNFSGAGDFITIFTGDTLREYQYYPQNKGAIVSNMTFSYNYFRQGTYTITAVATSYGNWAEDSEQDVMSEEITIVDSRTGMTDFFIKSLDIKGDIDREAGTISFSMSSLLDRTALVATFFTESSDAVVSVNDVVQVSDVTPNDFTDPVVYSVVAPDGTAQDYTTDITLFFPSDEKQLLTFGMTNPEVAATIDEDAKTVILVAPAGTDLSRVRVVGTSSLLSTIKMQGKTLDPIRAKTVDLSTSPQIITVTAEDLTTQDYELTTTLEE